MRTHLDDPSARGPYMLRSSVVLVLIGSMCWRGKVKKGARLEWSLSIFQHFNFQMRSEAELKSAQRAPSHHSIIPLFHHSRCERSEPGSKRRNTHE